MVHNNDGSVYLTIGVDDFPLFSFIDSIDHERCTSGTGPINTE